MRTLVVNAGSSSLKLSVLDQSDHVVESENLELHLGRVEEDAVRRVIDQNSPIDAVGHRIVHGGTDFRGPVRVDAGVRDRLEALSDLAPLHQPKSLRALDLVTSILPSIPAVACFDTAFHADLPPAAATYALPAEWRRRWPLRRFGFHGLSHAYASRRTAGLSGRPIEELRIVSCHLGAGASLAAVLRGRSVDTTMGFTPLEGLVMATRSGSVDPGLVLWLEEHTGMPPSELASTLEHRAGLLGLTGSSDFAAIVDAASGGDGEAALALEIYVHRLRGAIAAMTAAMGGLDALVFTGGVGEHSPTVRARAASGLAFLGIALDEDANELARTDGELSSAEADVRTFVVAAREDLQIAHEVRSVLAGA